MSRKINVLVHGLRKDCTFQDAFLNDFKSEKRRNIFFTVQYLIKGLCFDIKMKSMKEQLA